MWKTCLIPLWALCLAIAAPLQSSAQSKLSDLVTLQVLDGGPLPDGRHLAALHMTLKSGWKTYWRVPGEAGIPPSFDWSGSRNVDGVDVVWPAPVVFDQSGYRSVGYKDQLVLPLILAPGQAGKPLRLKGHMDFGVCNDVCVPAGLPFALDLDPQAGRNAKITAALAQRPYTAAEAGVARATCALRPDAGGMQIETRIDLPRAKGGETVVVEPGNPRIWASDMVSRRAGGTLIAQGALEHVDGGSFALNRSEIRITVLSRGQAVEINGCTPG